MSSRCGAITLVRMLDQACFTQFFQTRVENRRRDRFATFLQLAEGAGSAFAEVPQNAQCPASPQQGQEGHDRAPGSGPPDRSPGAWSLAHEGIAFLVVGCYGRRYSICSSVTSILFGRLRQHRIEPVQGSLAVVIAFGLFAAICNAVGLIAWKPALLAGTGCLAATALRTGGGALVISVVALWPAEALETPTKRTPSVVFRA